MKKFLLLFITFFAIVINNVSAQTVYITKTGQKYHADGCRYLSHSKYDIDLKGAIQKGYEACSVCKPPINITSSTQRKVTSSNNENKNAVSMQCTAITKARTRCKRMTKSSIGYCWQHGGN